MMEREKIVEILEKAHRIDRDCELFGTSKHRYRLNPPISAEVVRKVEETYGFQFPEDYIHFITKIGNGGAGPDYGINSLEKSLMSHLSSKFQEKYKSALKLPFSPRPMRLEEIEYYAFTRTSYEKNPEKFFVCQQAEEDGDPVEPGFLVLGTHGCQWDFGLVVSGERRGQVFDTDNEGGYMFVASSFCEFYQRWLDWLSDLENVKKKLEFWHNLGKKRG